MARRKEHTHAQIRQMAIDAVVVHLQSDSLNNLSLRKVATQIGYVPSTLINIFGSYQYLLLAVSEQTLTQLYQNLVKIAQDDPTETIVTMAIGYSQFATQQPQCFRLMFELVMPDDMPLPDGQALRIQALFQLIDTQLQRRFPISTRPQRELMSRVIWSGIHGLTMLALDDKLFAEQVSLTAMLTSQVQHYLIGIETTKELVCY